MRSVSSGVVPPAGPSLVVGDSQGAPLVDREDPGSERRGAHRPVAGVDAIEVSVLVAPPHLEAERPAPRLGACQVGIEDPELLRPARCVFLRGARVVLVGARGADDLDGEERGVMAGDPGAEARHLVAFGRGRRHDVDVGVDADPRVGLVPAQGKLSAHLCVASGAPRPGQEERLDPASILRWWGLDSGTFSSSSMNQLDG